MDKVIQVWCEYGLGQEDFVFTDFDAAYDWLKKSLLDCGVEDEIEDLESAGYVGFTVLEVIGNEEEE